MSTRKQIKETAFFKNQEKKGMIAQNIQAQKETHKEQSNEESVPYSRITMPQSKSPLVKKTIEMNTRYA